MMHVYNSAVPEVWTRIEPEKPLENNEIELALKTSITCPCASINKTVITGR
jgi:hypothetical protein